MRRDVSIDFLKFLAVVFVVNSHLDVCYPAAYRALATGGSLGDALFFFCSGFTLFLGRDGEFVSWYKRRIARILPSVLVCVLAYSCWLGHGWYRAVGGYWFIQCIMIYYVVLFVVRKYFSGCLWLPFVLTGVLVCGWWFAFEDPNHSIYGGGHFMWSHYFIPMLLGAAVGRSRERMRFTPLLDCAGLVCCVGIYFALWKYALGHDGWQWLQLSSIPFLSLIMYFLYRTANAPIVLRFMSGMGGEVLKIIGGLCLEVYLSHRVFLTDRWNGIFPINILLVFVGALVVAYFVRCVSRFVVQTLNDSMDGYCFDKIFSIK